MQRYGLRGAGAFVKLTWLGSQFALVKPSFNLVISCIVITPSL